MTLLTDVQVHTYIAQMEKDLNSHVLDSIKQTNGIDISSCNYDLLQL